MNNTGKETRDALDMARRTLALLEKQAAGHTALTIPAHLQIELEEKQREVAKLEARLNGVATAASPAPAPPVDTASLQQLQRPDDVQMESLSNSQSALLDTPSDESAAESSPPPDAEIIPIEPPSTVPPPKDPLVTSTVSKAEQGNKKKGWFMELAPAAQATIIGVLITTVGGMIMAFIGIGPDLFRLSTPTQTATYTPTIMPTVVSTEASSFSCQEFTFDTQPLCWHTRYYDEQRYGGELVQRDGVLEFPINFARLPVDPATQALRKGMIEFTTEPEAELPDGCSKQPLTNIPYGSYLVAEVSIPPELQGVRMEFFVQTTNYKWYGSRPVKELTHSGEYRLESGEIWVRLIDGEEVAGEWGNDSLLKYGIEFNMDADEVKAQDFIIRIDNVKVCTPTN